MPDVIEQDEITITEAELAARAERLGVEYPQAAQQATVERVLQFINESDNESDLKRISRLSRRKLRDMGVIPRPKPQKKPNAFKRFIARLGTESAPIVFTAFITLPLVVWGSYLLLKDIGFFSPNHCPPSCSGDHLIVLAVISSLSVLFVYLTYAILRKFFLKLRP